MCNLGDAIKEAGREEGRLETIIEFLNAGRITIDEAAVSVNMTVEDFLKKREEYKKETL